MGKEIDLRKHKKVEAQIDKTGLATEATLQLVLDKLTELQTILDAHTTQGTWGAATETSVTNTATLIQSANTNRKRLVIQNVGNAPARIGIIGVTATTGTQLLPGGTMVMQHPYCEGNAIYAIREGLVNTTILTQETT